MELPAALIPWRESLELLDPTAAAALGPILQRLDLAIGPFRTHGRSGDGDPEGFSGIARRGTYERLLISEWLLAEEMPEEFTRRALTGEHAFLQLARRTPAGEQQCVALFDAGPDQWGTPRTAHLAALIVLERRARAAGVTFRWGTLQDDDFRLRPAGDEAALRQMLGMRSSRPATARQLSGWSSRIASPCPAQRELWIIGGARAVSLVGAGMSALRLEEPLEPDTARLDATVLRSTVAPRALVLPLPDEPTCVRLLRDPFQTAVATPQRAGDQFAPASNLVFSNSGNKLFARSHTGALISYPIPNSPLAGAGKPRLFRPQMPGTIIAAGRTRKVTVALLADRTAERLHLEWLSGSHVRLPEGPVQVSMGLDWGTDDAPLGMLYGVWPDSDVQLFAHVQDLLLRIKKNKTGRSTEIIATGVEAVTISTQWPAYVYRFGNNWVKTSLAPDAADLRVVRPDAGRRACSGFGGAAANPHWGLSGLEYGDGSWCVESGETVWQFNPPVGTEVFGVIGPLRYGESPALVVLDADRRTISVLGLNWTHRLPEASTEIRHTAVSTVAAQIAYSTVQGEVVVYSLPHTAILYRLTPTRGDR